MFGNNKKIKGKYSHMNSDTKKILIISISIFVIIFLIVFLYMKKQNENYNNIKEFKNNFLVYTKYERENNKYKVYVPYVNIKSDIISSVNRDIDLFVNEFVASEKSLISYEYNISGIILSVIVKVVDYDTDYAPKAYFRSYNINLNTLEVISDESLLDFYGTNTSNVESTIQNQFVNYYDQIVNEGYYQRDECNYNCFLIYRDFKDYLENVVYFVRDGNLIAFKPFVFYSIYGEEEFFEDKDFEFLIVKGEDS